MKIICVGSKVAYKLWGQKEIRTAKVDAIEICPAGSKYGRHVTKCDIHAHRNVVLDLSDNHWIYANQIVNILNN